MIVLDTHAWVWYVDSPEKLSAGALAAIEDARRKEHLIYVSSISAWEIHMLVSKGRLSLMVPSDVWVSRCENLGIFSFFPVDNAIARLAVLACAEMHGDPADRIIVATALNLGAKLVTRDNSIRDCGIVECIW